MKLSPFKRWLYRMDYKYNRYAIQNLTLILAAGMAIVCLGTLINPRVNLMSYLTLDRAAVFSGQVWRLFTFIFVPPTSSFYSLYGLFMTALSIYVFYWIGTAVENSWSSLKFNFYYLIGMLGAIIAAMITGFGSSLWLNTSLFLAYACLFSDQQLLLFFIIPVKAKWLGWFEGGLLILYLIIGSWADRVSILLCIANFLLFFGSDLLGGLKSTIRYWKSRRQFRR
ncbi:MAG: hypothetical protein Q4G07_06725 [Oscillospiraceae bacterium]|nr:hypothetical protein [Oscillospiraceae bacterium]